MKKEEKDFKAGEECFYWEDGGILRCEILEREVRENFLYVTLIVLELIKKSDIMQSLQKKVGEVFEVYKKLDEKNFCYLLWYIYDPNDMKQN